MASNRQPKILFLDIETAPIVMATWTLFEANAVYVLRDTYIIAVGYRWLGDKRAQCKILPDFPRYKKKRHCDKALMGFIWNLLDEADIVVAHNGDRFDIKKINSRLWVHGHRRPSPYKTIDTLKWARGSFKLDSNKLDNIVRYKGLGRKLANTGAALWHGCCELGEPKSWATMREYCAHDTDLLSPVYHDMKGWAPNHPNLNLYTGGTGCPTCQSKNVARRGLNYGKSIVRQRMLCGDCGTSFSGATVK